MASTIVFVAPQGSGKTQHLTALCVRYGCQRVVDDWSWNDPLIPGALHLTNAEQPLGWAGAAQVVREQVFLSSERQPLSLAAFDDRYQVTTEPALEAVGK